MSSHSWKKTLFPLSNVLMLFLSIAIFVIGIWKMLMRAPAVCETPASFASDDLLIYAALLMMIGSVVGLIFCCCSYRPWFFYIYVVFMFMVIVLCLAGVILAYTVASEGSGTKLPGKAYKEYNLGSYSKRIQSKVKDPKYWNQTKTCIIRAKICTTFNNKYLNDTAEKFYKERLTSLQSGCCKPSNDCGFTYQSPANWSEENGVFDKNPDCKAWDNDPKVLCFNCESCKAGVADHLKHELRKEANVALGLCIVFLILSFIACYAFKSPLDDNGFDINYTNRRPLT